MACLRLNGYTLNLDQAQLFDLHGQAVELRPQALAVLLELGRRHGELVTKLDLSARVWPGVSVTDDSLVQCVVEIRRALGDTRQQVVRTMPRRGYLLIVDAADTAPRDVQSFYRLAAALAMVAVAIVLVWQFPLLGADPSRRQSGRQRIGRAARHTTGWWSMLQFCPCACSTPLAKAVRTATDWPT